MCNVRFIKDSRMADVRTAAGMQLLAHFLGEQITVLVSIESLLRQSDLPRVARLHPLVMCMLEDSISIRLLGNDARTNQIYVIARALVERCTNYCYLLLCDEKEFTDYVDYSLSKAGRRIDRSIEVHGEVRARISLEDGTVELPLQIQQAIAKFTSDRGREKTRWTNVSLPERAAAVDARVKTSGLFMALLTIYTDASEALHGTLYGSLFHLGVYDYGAAPHDQESLDQHRCTTLSCLYLISGGLLDTLFQVLVVAGETYCSVYAEESKKRFRAVSVQTGLA